MNSICHPAVAQASTSASPRSWLAGLQQAWTVWREQTRQQADWRALEQLSASTRRDIGLSDRTPLATGRTLWEHERGIW